MLSRAFPTRLERWWSASFDLREVSLPIFPHATNLLFSFSGQPFSPRLQRSLPERRGLRRAQPVVFYFRYSFIPYTLHLLPPFSSLCSKILTAPIHPFSPLFSLTVTHSLAFLHFFPLCSPFHKSHCARGARLCLFHLLAAVTRFPHLSFRRAPVFARSLNFPTTARRNTEAGRRHIYSCKLVLVIVAFPFCLYFRRPFNARFFFPSSPA